MSITKGSKQLQGTLIRDIEGLSVRTKNCLLNHYHAQTKSGEIASLKTLGDLVLDFAHATEREWRLLFKQKNFGKKSQHELRMFLEDLRETSPVVFSEIDNKIVAITLNSSVTRLTALVDKMESEMFDKLTFISKRMSQATEQMDLIEAQATAFGNIMKKVNLIRQHLVVDLTTLYQHAPPDLYDDLTLGKLHIHDLMWLESSDRGLQEPAFNTMKKALHEYQEKGRLTRLNAQRRESSGRTGRSLD